MSELSFNDVKKLKEELQKELSAYSELKVKEFVELTGIIPECSMCV